jgi:hypothetical protein
MSQRAFRTSALSIGEQYTEENIKSNKGKLWKRVRAYPLDHPTTNDYVDSEILDARLLKDKLFHIKNTSTNGLQRRILACIDPKLWTIIVTEGLLAAGAETKQVSSDPYAYYKIQVKSYVADTPATVRAFMSGSSL